jgi:hypothetical protein
LTQRREPGWIDRGRIVLCSMQDPTALREVVAWMTDSHHAEARAVCTSALATWPGAESLRGPIFEHALRIQEGWLSRSEIDPAVVAGAYVMGTPEMREQLVPVLTAGHERQALGYDRLREAVCADDRAMSSARARACSTLPVEAEDEWRRGEEPGRRVAMGGATGLYAGAITAAAVERKHEAGRLIASGAGVPLGVLFGASVCSIIMTPSRGQPAPARSELASALISAGCLIVGGAVGGLAAYSLAASPSARAPVTALALAPVYLGTLLVLEIAD